MSACVIRAATVDDLETIADFNARLAEETEDTSLDRETVRQGVRALLSDPTRGAYYVASADGRIIGQIMHTREWSDWRNGMFIWIQSVYVRAEQRRKGVFKALYNHVTELASSPGYCGVRLYVHDGNTPARETYLRLGMVEPGYTVLDAPDRLRDD